MFPFITVFSVPRYATAVSVCYNTPVLLFNNKHTPIFSDLYESITYQP
jgi:hypothetical protein